MHPNNGPHGGWISGEIALAAASKAYIEIVVEEYRIRSAAGVGNSVIGKGYSGQRFVVVGSAVSGTGCSNLWYPISVSGSYSPRSVPTWNLSATTGWICGDGVDSYPAPGTTITETISSTDTPGVIPDPGQFTSEFTFPSDGTIRESELFFSVYAPV